MDKANIDNDGWEEVEPQVNAVAEFTNILRDFGNPLELLREAISNSIDHAATWIKITFTVEMIEGSWRSVITILDDGEGMPRETLNQDFWGLGFSKSKEDPSKIGEKGHGTKIFLRSEHVIVRTNNAEGSYTSECIKPLSRLSNNQLHQPRTKSIAKPFDHFGTEIKIIGYNDNERSKFVEKVVKDYLKWFTKIGSIEKIFDVQKYSEFKVYLKCLDQEKHDEILFGHFFPPENSDIDKLFEEKGPDAADWYVKRYVWKNSRLINHPEVMFDTVISVEGDEVKKDYNELVGERRRSETGRYRMSDRYGIWLCKDYIPVRRVNDWITGFGSGSNAFVLLHGFVNCQSLELTANRGDIANAESVIFEELKTAVQKQIEKIDMELDRKGIYTLRGWQKENRTIEQEKAEFSRRIKNLKGRKVARLSGRLLVEPANEAELCSLLITIYSMHPDLFEFEPLDYNTNKGIDIIARNKSDNKITEGEHWYIELKHRLQTKRFNHAFKFIRWIVCWDFDRDIVRDCELYGIENDDIRQLQFNKDNKGDPIYFLDCPRKAGKIQVIRLKEFLSRKLKLDFIE